MASARRNTPKDSLAGAASDRVRAIIEAAESSAAEIRAEAEAEAERIRSEAEERASTLRREARSDVQGLLGSIRGAVDRLRSDLEQLEARLGEPEEAPRPAPATAAPPAAAAAPPTAAEESEEEPDIVLAEDAAVGLHETPSDAEAARLVALNMALNEASREDVDRHLREHYGVSDPKPLIDEVFASVGR